MMNFNMVTAFTEYQASFRNTSEGVSSADTYRDMMKKVMKSAKTEKKDSAEPPKTEDGTQENGDEPVMSDENAAALIQANAELNALVWIQPPIAPASDFVQPEDQTAGQVPQEMAIEGLQETFANTPEVSEENVLAGKNTEGSLPIGEPAFSVEGMEAAVKENSGAADKQTGVTGNIPEKQAETEKAEPEVKEQAAISTPVKKDDGKNGEAEAVKLQAAPEGAENLQPVRQQEVQEAAPLSRDGMEESTLKLPEEIPIRLQAGEKEFTVQMEPEHLGKLMIKASYQDGKAVVSIICTNEKTLELLSNRAGDLGSLMEKSLGMPAEVYLDKTEQNYLNLAQDGRNGRRDDQEEKENKEGKHREKSESPDFLQQLRLGLV